MVDPRESDDGRLGRLEMKNISLSASLSLPLYIHISSYLTNTFWSLNHPMLINFRRI